MHFGEISGGSGAVGFLDLAGIGMMYRVLDLFSGIGGFSLGLERTGGFETVAFCEIEDYPRKVLAKHWPGVPIYEDVRELTAERLRADGLLWDARDTGAERIMANPHTMRMERARAKQQATRFSGESKDWCGIDIITGGFPCQDLSAAGKQAGIEAERSGLWSELCRLIGEIRPRYAIIENVPNLLSGDDGRWFARVLRDLAEIGFDAEWHCIPAAAVHAPHLRDRVWIVAYPQHPDTDEQRSHRAGMYQHGGVELRNQQVRDTGQVCEDVAYPDAGHCGRENDEIRTGWLPEPDVGRVAHGVPSRVDRLKGLGNAVVPQIATLIGEAILND